MAGILCVWANIPDDAMDWYENEYIPAMRTKHSIHTLQCNLTPSGFEGDPIGQLDAPWPLFAVYEVPEVEKATQACYDMHNHPPEEMLSGQLKDAQFDVRTYRELRRWESEDWDGDVSQVACVGAMEWRVPEDRQEEIFDFYTTFVAPKMIESPDVLRFRVLEVDNATVLHGDSFETKEKSTVHTYFTFVEMETEDWPWDAILELDTVARYREYFEGQKVVKWQLSSYLVKKLYNAKDPNGKVIRYDSSDEGTSSESVQV